MAATGQPASSGNSEVLAEIERVWSLADRDQGGTIDAAELAGALRFIILQEEPSTHFVITDLMASLSGGQKPRALDVQKVMDVVDVDQVRVGDHAKSLICTRATGCLRRMALFLTMSSKAV